MQLATVRHVATYPVTTGVAEGTICAMKGSFTYDHRYMSQVTQIGFLLPMVNGNTNKRILSWALYVQTSFLNQAVFCV
jgi:hypothetical protein